MDILKRDLAPVTDAAWEVMENEAREVFAQHLSARKLVSVGKPRGIACSAVDLGHLEIPDGADSGPVRWGVRRVQPLVETRVSFEVDVWELDDVERGSKTPDLTDLRRAARDLARFEETALYEGFPEAGIVGLMGAAGADPVAVNDEPSSLPQAIARAADTFRDQAVAGPYALAVGPTLHRRLQAESEGGYPIGKHIGALLEGSVHLAPFLSGGVLVSRRGDDTEMTLGQDISIGYEGSDARTVRLFFTESFTFRVLTPEAAVPLRSA